MRNAAQTHSAQTVNSALRKTKSGKTLDDFFRFKGNLIVYREEFSSLPSANSSEAISSSKDSLVQRYNAKKGRLVSRPINLASPGTSPAYLLQELNETQRGSWMSLHGRTIAAMMGCVLIGIGIGSFWVFPKQQSSDTASTSVQPLVGTAPRSISNGSAVSSSVSSDEATSSTAAAVITRNTDEVNTVALKERTAESDGESAEYRNEVEVLRNQNSSLARENSSLSSENTALVEETVGLNRELLDLEVKVVELQDKVDSFITIETKVVYNFVNVPIGSDPGDGYDAGTNNPVADHTVNKSSYNNSPSVLEELSE